jgi:hypothetical protein
LPARHLTSEQENIFERLYRRIKDEYNGEEDLDLKDSSGSKFWLSALTESWLNAYTALGVKHRPLELLHEEPLEYGRSKGYTVTAWEQRDTAPFYGEHGNDQF